MRPPPSGGFDSWFDQAELSATQHRSRGWRVLSRIAQSISVVSLRGISLGEELFAYYPHNRKSEGAGLRGGDGRYRELVAYPVNMNGGFRRVGGPFAVDLVKSYLWQEALRCTQVAKSRNSFGGWNDMDIFEKLVTDTTSLRGAATPNRS
mmetsp:Transcript_34362/g.110408  ORF Transcript_34362/g.110408 Transcript_34362/m.110408 type:complete len:150 (+) Transcript_34362:1045-1494(+)